MHVSVSSVLGDMLRTERVEEFLAYSSALRWTRHAQRGEPSTQACWKLENVITESERQDLIRLQDRWNKKELTVNYLGHSRTGDISVARRTEDGVHRPVR